MTQTGLVSPQYQNQNLSKLEWSPTMKKLVYLVLAVVMFFGLVAARPQAPSITVDPGTGNFTTEFSFSGYIGRVGKFFPTVDVNCSDGFAAQFMPIVAKDGTFMVAGFNLGDYYNPNGLQCSADLVKYDRLGTPEVVASTVFTVTP